MIRSKAKLNLKRKSNGKISIQRRLQIDLFRFQSSTHADVTMDIHYPCSNDKKKKKKNWNVNVRFGQSPLDNN